METIYQLDVIFGQLSFRPSYEGWKLQIPVLPLQNWSPFRPSYEGWKPKEQEGEP